jgi:hypothetical protein
MIETAPISPHALIIPVGAEWYKGYVVLIIDG